MATIDYKQKIKDYMNSNEVDTPYKSMLNNLFPELKESEDGNIGKEIIAHIKWCEDSGYCSKEEMTRWITFLKKQGEQKPTMLELCEIEHIEHGKFYYCIKDYYDAGNKIASKGDVIQALKGTSIMGLGVRANEYFIPVYKIIQEPVSWSEEDEKMIRALVSMCDVWTTSHQFYPKENKEMEALKTWLKSIKDRVQPKQEWKQENTGDLTDFENAMMHIGDSFFGQHQGLDPNDTSVVKEQAKLLLELMPQKEWSEEDEYLYTWCMSAIQTRYDDGLFTGNEYTQTSLWLKSLKDRYTWKPSEEQMEALDFAANCIVPAEFCVKRKVLKELLEQIKKLR